MKLTTKPFKLFINRCLNPLGISIQRKHALEDLLGLFASQTSAITTDSLPLAEGIVFSRDRALQLHSLLSSYFFYVKNPAPIHILYTTSNSAHQKSYDHLFTFFSDKLLSITRQNQYSFRNNLIALLEKIRSPKVFFLVDDVIFINHIDFNEFTKYDTTKFVPSLRLGLNLTKCYTKQKKQPLPIFETELIKESGKFFWKWNSGYYDWGYPLSVDGNLFTTNEIRYMAGKITYKAPNSFESNLQRFFPLFAIKWGVCWEHSIIMNIPCNKVQTEIDNSFGTIQQNDLLTKWNEGFRFDYKIYNGFSNKSAHQDVPFKFVHA